MSMKRFLVAYDISSDKKRRIIADKLSALGVRIKQIRFYLSRGEAVSGRYRPPDQATHGERRQCIHPTAV